MIPETVVPKDVYRDAFKQYVFDLVMKWLGLRAELSSPSLVLDKIEEISGENHRAVYLKYLLPLAEPDYFGLVPTDIIVQMHKVLHSLRMNDLAYNDFMVNRFCDILLESVDRKGLLHTPLPEGYKDLQKLVWMFVQAFRKNVAPQYSQGHEVI